MPALQKAPVMAYVALGANLGEAQQTVLRAIDALALLPGTELTNSFRAVPHGTP
jgi:2-amino-4-hydroxy-6-hydroxymethyldihydropteridine diphosphokinase